MGYCPWPRFDAGDAGLSCDACACGRSWEVKNRLDCERALSPVTLKSFASFRCLYGRG